MRWEDQELNFETEESFPEIVFAFHSIVYISPKNEWLDVMVVHGEAPR
jgi:hypothetical protein